MWINSVVKCQGKLTLIYVIVCAKIHTNRTVLNENVSPEGSVSGQPSGRKRNFYSKPLLVRENVLNKFL